MAWRKKNTISDIQNWKADLWDGGYIVYCRKSSDESSEHQQRSIADQIDACIKYAESHWLKIKPKPKDFSVFETEEDIQKEDSETDSRLRKVYQNSRGLYIVKEEKSAKIAGKRKKWREIIKKIRKWEIRGLISYSPDRQSRNMLEWWELIDCVDQELVDLKYTNFHFEDTADWKMMLGIWFVFSKQYSDKLSTDSLRWNKSAMASGFSLWRYKPWYRTNEKWYFEPDPKMFPLIQEAFRMKLEDKASDKLIIRYLNANGYKRIYKNDRESTLNESDGIGNWWIDEFYYGVYIHGDYVSNQLEDNPHYKPVITEQEHKILKARFDNNTQRATKSATKDIYADIRIFDDRFIKTADTTRDSFFCFTLPNPKRYKDKLWIAREAWEDITLKDIVKMTQIQYKCSDANSKWHNTSISAQAIDELVRKQLKKFQVSEKDFEDYKVFIASKLDSIEEKRKHKTASKNLEINRLHNEKTQYLKENMSLKRDADEEKIYQDEKKRIENKIEYLQAEIKELTKKERDEIFELEAFVNVLNNAEQYYDNSSFVQKNEITKMLFSNIFVDHQKRLSLAVKPWLEHLFTGNGSAIWVDFEQMHLFISESSLSFIRPFISLYIKEFGGYSSALGRLSKIQREYYRIEKVEAVNTRYPMAIRTYTPR